MISYSYYINIFINYIPRQPSVKRSGYGSYTASEHNHFASQFFSKIKSRSVKEKDLDDVTS